MTPCLNLQGVYSKSPGYTLQTILMLKGLQLKNTCLIKAEAG